MRVPLILKDIETRTEDLTEREVITQIIDTEETHLRELDDKMKWLKNFERLLEIQRESRSAIPSRLPVKQFRANRIYAQHCFLGNILWPSVVDLDPKVYIPEVGCRETYLSDVNTLTFFYLRWRIDFFEQFLKGPLSKQPCERLIVSPRRQIILEGPLNVLDSGKPVEMYLLLFDDMFMITRRKKGLNKKVR